MNLVYYKSTHLLASQLRNFIVFGANHIHERLLHTVCRASQSADLQVIQCAQACIRTQNAIVFREQFLTSGNTQERAFDQKEEIINKQLLKMIHSSNCDRKSLKRKLLTSLDVLLTAEILQ